MKIVINGCYGGFSISIEAARHMSAAGSEQAKKDVADYDAEIAAFEQYKASPQPRVTDDKWRSSMFDIYVKHGGQPPYHGYGYVEGFDSGYERTDPLLVAAVEALGDAANGSCAQLKVVEIPDGTDYELSEYDGIEHIAEKHRTWS